MPFQHSAFQPEPRPRRFRRERTRVRAVWYHFKASGFLPALDQSAWQRGHTDVPGWLRRKPVLVEIGSAVAGGGFGLTLGSTWWERGLFGSLFAVAALVLGLFGLWLYYSLTAPVRQREEAREYARALEARHREFENWSARIVSAFDFRHQALEDVRRLSAPEPQLMGSAADEEERWRNQLLTACAYVEEHGADVSAFRESQLAALEDRAPYPHDLSRIWNSMLSAGQNLLAEMRNIPAPRPPNPPGVES
jgi:hypothetical protein